MYFILSLRFLPNEPFELMEEERRDDRSIFKQVEAISSPCIYRRDLDICL